MKLAIFSDIHGNLEALEAFIQDAAGRQVDRYLCLGDVVGYGASPGQCLERLETLPHLGLIVGNHDAAAIWKTSPYQMTSSARRAILWTMDQLSADQTRRLAGLDETLQLQDLMFCHANPYHPNGWQYITTWFGAMRSFLASAGRITFVGHTHRPQIITRGPGYKIDFADPPVRPLPLAEDCRYIINCGSVGQPRDGNADASYVTYDTDTRQVAFIRCRYDIAHAARRIEKAGLPGSLAERLYRGR